MTDLPLQTNLWEPPGETSTYEEQDVRRRRFVDQLARGAGFIEDLRH